MEIFEKVYKVFGDELPVGTSEFSAVVAAPVSVLEIKKAFKTYENFKTQYIAFCMQKRAKAVEKATVTKAPAVNKQKDVKDGK